MAYVPEKTGFMHYWRVWCINSTGARRTTSDIRQVTCPACLDRIARETEQMLVPDTGVCTNGRMRLVLTPHAAPTIEYV